MICCAGSLNLLIFDKEMTMTSSQRKPPMAGKTYYEPDHGTFHPPRAASRMPVSSSYNVVPGKGARIWAVARLRNNWSGSAVKQGEALISCLILENMRTTSHSATDLFSSWVPWDWGLPEVNPRLRGKGFVSVSRDCPTASSPCWRLKGTTNIL